MAETTVKRSGFGSTAAKHSRDSLTLIRMPDGRVIERVGKESINRALTAAGKKLAESDKKK